MDAQCIVKPIFILGCGRSGTSVVYETWALHPDLSWFSNYSQRVPGLPLAAVISRLPRGSKEDNRRLPRPLPDEGHKIFDRCAPARSAARNEEPLTAGDLQPGESRRLRRAVYGHLRYQGGSRFLNKNTRNTRRIDYLDAVFPDALFVHVTRDPLATVSSLLRVSFWNDMIVPGRDGRRVRDLVADGEDPVSLAARFWTDEVSRVDEGLLSIDTGRWTTLRYEDFTARPEAELRRLCEFAELTVPAPFVRAVEQCSITERNSRSTSLFAAADAEVIWRICDERAAAHGYQQGPSGE